MRARWIGVVMAMAACGNETPLSGLKVLPGDGVGVDLGTPSKTDRIQQTRLPEVDVLWVIDDSLSMEEEQAKLADNFGSFITFFLDSGLDWHIGVVSTDTEDTSKNGRLQGAGGYRYVDPTTPNPIGVFRQMAQLGVDGSFTERGLLAAHRALALPTAELQRVNDGFYRQDAALHVIVISDEDDQSAPALTRNEFITFLQDLKTDPDVPVTFSSIVGPLPSGCASDDGTATAGSTYLAVTNAVGGIARSICEDDWAPVLEDLGLQAAGLRREYFLSEVPVPGTIEVWVVDGDTYFTGVDASTLTGGRSIGQACEALGSSNCFPFAYNATRNSVYLQDLVPSPAAEVNIRYDLLRGLQPDNGDVLDPSAGVDTGAP
ncbi:MAG: hypothetical protein H6733_16280 [Alphaproteobacteria bacterium]|nr:hypothetical protein [Alphaproteobacteria bacterium]